MNDHEDNMIILDQTDKLGIFAEPEYKLEQPNILTKTKPSKKLTCETLLVSKRRICGEMNFLNYTRLKKLDCSFNKIENIDGKLPITLLDLNCSHNKIKMLNNLPTSLKILNCSYNEIVMLDYLPNNIYKLDCAYNKLILLDNLPNSLGYLFCNNNNITSLNNLPRTLKHLHCHNNSENIELDNLPNLEKIIYE